MMRRCTTCGGLEHQHQYQDACPRCGEFIETDDGYAVENPVICQQCYDIESLGDRSEHKLGVVHFNDCSVNFVSSSAGSMGGFSLIPRGDENRMIDHIEDIDKAKANRIIAKIAEIYPELLRPVWLGKDAEAASFYDNPDNIRIK